MSIPHPPGTVATNSSGRSRIAIYKRTLLSSYAAFVVNVGLYALATPWILHRLGASQFGTWLILLQTAYIVTLGTMWIASPLMREAATHYARQNVSALRLLLVSGAKYYAVIGVLAISAFAVAGVLPPVHRALHLDSSLRSAMVLMGVYTALSLQTQVILNILSGYQRPDTANWFTLGLSVASTGLAVVVVAMGYGIVGLAGAYVAAAILVYAAAVAYLHFQLGIHPFARGFDWALLSRLLRSGRSYLGYSLSYLVLQSDLLLVGGLLGPAAAAVYGIAYKLVDYSVQVIWRIPDSLTSIIAELHASADQVRLQAAHRAAFRTALALASVTALIIWRYGQGAVTLWLGQGYTPDHSLFGPFALLVITQVAVHSSIVVPYGSAHMRGVAQVSIAEALVKVMLAVILLRRIGLSGVVIATVIAQSSGTLWFAAAAACRITGDAWRPLLVSILRPLIVPAGGAAAVAFAMHGSETWVSLLAGSAAVSATFAVLYLTLSVDADQRRIIRDMIAGGV